MLRVMDLVIVAGGLLSEYIALNHRHIRNITGSCWERDHLLCVEHPGLLRRGGFSFPGYLAEFAYTMPSSH